MVNGCAFFDIVLRDEKVENLSQDEVDMELDASIVAVPLMTSMGNCDTDHHLLSSDWKEMSDNGSWGYAMLNCD